ncbi:MAG: hypothetical protein N2378_01310 [Chloroflexaceae bacterium]|nr:hypothetical protein [Chloroflexaceae bacterium]
MKRIITGLFIVLLAQVFWPPGMARAQSGLEVVAVPAFDGNYQPGAWLPIHVYLKNTGAARAVSVAVQLPNASFRNVHPVDLPAGAEKRIVLYGAMEQEVRSVRLTVEADGAVLVANELPVRPRINERLLGIVASADLRLSLPRRQDMAGEPFTVVRLPATDLPDRMAGLSSLGFLLLADVPTAELSPAQRQALLGWVSAGGHLIIGGGPTAARTLAGLPPQLQPATPGGAARVPDAPLASLAGASGPGALPGIRLTPAPTARAAPEGDPPAWVQQTVGVGMVTQLAFDPGTPVLVAWEGAPRFWDQLLRSFIQTSTPFGPEPGVDGYQENILAGALTATPTISLPPTQVIFALLAVYAILAGPGLALALKRFDAQAMMWLAVPALALLTGVVVFGMALALRADQRVIHQISLVEVIGEGQARARTLTGVLAPQEQTFIADRDPGALVRPLRAAAGQYGEVDGVKGDLAQESPTLSFPVAPWRIQRVLAEQQLAFPGVSARISIQNERLVIEMENRSDRTLHEVVAAYGEYVLRLGRLDPGARVIQVWPDTPPADVRRGETLSYLVLREELEAGRGPGQAPDRATLVREALVSAALSRGIISDEGPVVLAWLERSPLQVAVRAPGAARREMTLLVLRPVFTGSGAVSVPPGWLRPAFITGEQAPCAGIEGRGVAVVGDPFTLALRLPPGMGPLRAEALTLTFESTGRWPNAGVATLLYDWERRRWVEQDFDGPGTLRVADPAPYLREGQLLARFEGRIGEARCVYVDATLRGVMP